MNLPAKSDRSVAAVPMDFYNVLKYSNNELDDIAACLPVIYIAVFSLVIESYYSAIPLKPLRIAPITTPRLAPNANMLVCIFSIDSTKGF